MKHIIDYLREILGERAYERYCDYLRREGQAHKIPSVRDFYLDSLKRRYARPSRCC